MFETTRTHINENHEQDYKYPIFHKNLKMYEQKHMMHPQVLENTQMQSPKVKTTKKERVGARSLTPNTFG
jgi:hypothetical protein